MGRNYRKPPVLSRPESGGQGTAEGQIAALEKAGIAVAKSPATMAGTLIARLKG